MHPQSRPNLPPTSPQAADETWWQLRAIFEVARERLWWCVSADVLPLLSDELPSITAVYAVALYAADRPSLFHVPPPPRRTSANATPSTGCALHRPHRPHPSRYKAGYRDVPSLASSSEEKLFLALRKHTKGSVRRHRAAARAMLAEARESISKASCLPPPHTAHTADSGCLTPAHPPPNPLHCPLLTSPTFAKATTARRREISRIERKLSGKPPADRPAKRARPTARPVLPSSRGGAAAPPKRPSPLGPAPSARADARREGRASTASPYHRAAVEHDLPHLGHTANKPPLPPHRL